MMERVKSLPINLSYLTVFSQSQFSDFVHTERVCEYDQVISVQDKPCILFIDLVPNRAFLQKYLLHARGENPNCIRIIFSNFSVIASVLNDSFLEPFFINGQIQCWHISEWEQMLKKEMLNGRSSLFYCQSIVSQGKHPVVEQSARMINEAGNKIRKRVLHFQRKLSRYYLGDRFKKRLLEIADGALPKVYIERKCHSVAVKRFSDSCARGLQEMGCEVNMHAPCTTSCIDYGHVLNLEMQSFVPDLCIRSPNMFSDAAVVLPPRGLPTFYSLQDIEPHLEYARSIQRYPMGHLDQVYVLLEQFVPEILKAGVDRSMLLKGNLPILELDLDKEKIIQDSDIGFVKTMSLPRSLREVLRLSDEKERRLADYYQGVLQKGICAEKLPDLDKDLSQAVQKGWIHDMVSFTHQELCYHFIKKLVGKGFDLSLSGSGWDQYPELVKYDRGHAEEDAELRKRYLQVKINLSMGAWMEYHPRIFEGGVQGAFFLVYQPKDGKTMHGLPKDIIPGIHLDEFSSSQELVEKCKYYLSNPHQAEKLGKNLQRLLKSRYSYQSFLSQVLENFRGAIRRSFTS